MALVGSMSSAVVSIFVIAIAGCTVEPLDLAGRSCPCVAGWVCSDADTCVPEADTGAPDADTGLLDAPADSDALDADSEIADSGVVDSTPVDSGDPRDADTGTTDTGVVDTACDDLLSGAFFCDGFEDPTLAAWDSREEADGTIDVVATPVFRGSGALRGETIAPDGRAGTVTSFAPIGSGELWIRGYFYVPSTVALSYVSFFYAFENAAPFGGVSVFVETGGTLGIYVAPSTFAGGGSPPLDAWFCLQARIDVADAGGSVQIWLDGVPGAMVADVDTRPAAPYTSAILGLERAGSMQASAVVYADELALGTTMLPCE